MNHSYKKNNELEIKNLTKKFDDKIIFSNLNFKVPIGSSIGIMGSSGIGKSILLKCILGLTEYTGTILYKEKILEGKNHIDLYENSGMLFQGGALFDSLNVWQNITFKLINGIKYYSKNECIIIAKKILTEVELSDEIYNLMPSELSGGMQKRVALARTILSRPNLLFFDEPTTGLDPLTKKAINNLIYKLINKRTVTSLIISHDPISIQKICDYVIFLHDNKIEWQGNINEMMSSKNNTLIEFINSNK